MTYLGSSLALGVKEFKAFSTFRRYEALIETPVSELQVYELTRTQKGSFACECEKSEKILEK